MIGVLVAIASLFLTWQIIVGENITMEWFRGYNYISGVMAPVTANTYIPDIVITGVALSYATIVQVLLVLLGIGAVYATLRTDFVQARITLVAWMSVIALAAWWVMYGLLQSGLLRGMVKPGPLVFLAGLGLIALGLFRTTPPSRG